jgi:uncharacterized protein YijF (DUF1287 family)
MNRPARAAAKAIGVALAIAVFAAPAAAPQASARAPGVAIARAAAKQIGVTLYYDPAYRRLDYPGGDVPRERGVCSDVVVRALRDVGVDLQVAVHEDMRRNFRDYPQLWGLRRPDRNIDHRRVPNLMRFFERQGKRVAPGGGYRTGDIVAWRLPNDLVHIGILAEQRGPRDPLVIHNIGGGAQLADVLHSFVEIGHYRW